MRKNKTVILNVSWDEKFIIQHRAKDLDLTLSQYLRNLVKKDMKKNDKRYEKIDRKNRK
tara:strand:+ start:110 stop:286 length:177 start_codon:yes stop_codon:yes gene_type:complete